MKSNPLHNCIYLLLPLALLTSSCGEALITTEVNISTPIVESYLEEGKNSLNVKLYSMEVYLGEDFVLSKPLTGLSLSVNDRLLEETSTAGTYALDLGSDTIRGLQEFSLSFEHAGSIVKATTQVPLPITGLSIDPGYIIQTYSYYWSDSDTSSITLSWDDPDQSYYQVYIVSPSTTTVNTPSGAVFGRRMMQPFQGSSHTMNARDFPTTGYYSIYLYRVNKDYAELYERISSTDLANPVSFIDNALGIFTSMSVARIGFSVVESEE
jgi:hypothetical protein